ncbi:MAG: hypothetical protein J6P18_02790 [Aeriscardovia sp.]|nr:hypothetical protein [Aeriscardovia sp.]
MKLITVRGDKCSEEGCKYRYLIILFEVTSIVASAFVVVNPSGVISIPVACALEILSTSGMARKVCQVGRLKIKTSKTSTPKRHAPMTFHLVLKKRRQSGIRGRFARELEAGGSGGAIISIKYNKGKLHVITVLIADPDKKWGGRRRALPKRFW